MMLMMMMRCRSSLFYSYLHHHHHHLSRSCHCWQMASTTRAMHFDPGPFSSIDCQRLPRCHLSISFWVFLLVVFHLWVSTLMLPSYSRLYPCFQTVPFLCTQVSGLNDHLDFTPWMANIELCNLLKVSETSGFQIWTKSIDMVEKPSNWPVAQVYTGLGATFATDIDCTFTSHCLHYAMLSGHIQKIFPYDQSSSL